MNKLCSYAQRIHAEARWQKGLQGILRGSIEVHSAGLMAAGVHRKAIAVMKELGLISRITFKRDDEKLLRQMDIVITLCGHAEDTVEDAS